MNLQRFKPFEVELQLSNSPVRGKVQLYSHNEQAELTGTGARPQCPYFSQGDCVTKAEQEVHIWKCADETEYCVYITDPAELPHYLGLAKKSAGG